MTTQQLLQSRAFRLLESFATVCGGDAEVEALKKEITSVKDAQAYLAEVAKDAVGSRTLLMAAFLGLKVSGEAVRLRMRASERN